MIIHNGTRQIRLNEVMLVALYKPRWTFLATSVSPEWTRICPFSKVGQALVDIELDERQMASLTTEAPFAP